MYPALEEFGRMLVDSGQQHSAALEAKAVSVAGWTAALLALMFSKDFTDLARQSPGLLLLTVVGVCAALAALYWGTKAIWLREWPMPSQQAWLDVKQFADINSLRVNHLLCMLYSYDEQIRIHDAKAADLKWAELALVVAAASLGGVVLWKLITSLWAWVVS